MSVPYAIETDDLTRRFGNRRVVEHLNLRVAQGGIHGFLGLNGAGKTTTIRLILGLIKPDAGSVHLFGEPFRRNALGRIGSLVEAPSLYPHLTGRGEPRSDTAPDRRAASEHRSRVGDRRSYE